MTPDHELAARLEEAIASIDATTYKHGQDYRDERDKRLERLGEEVYVLGGLILDSLRRAPEAAIREGGREPAPKVLLAIMLHIESHDPHRAENQIYTDEHCYEMAARLAFAEARDQLNGTSPLLPTPSRVPLRSTLAQEASEEAEIKDGKL